MAENETVANGAADAESGQEFGIQRLYVKDVSFESPNAPAIFLEQWQPELNLDLGTKVEKLEDDVHDVTLTVTATVKVADKVAFVVELKQAGIFMVKGFEEDQLKQMLGSYCPTILYPYARAAITNLVMDGGFPQLYLTPVNFDALYMQQLEQEAKGETATDA
jgi:preprotein translocase subunit SecB